MGNNAPGKGEGEDLTDHSNYDQVELRISCCEIFFYESSQNLIFDNCTPWLLSTAISGLAPGSYYSPV